MFQIDSSLLVDANDGHTNLRIGLLQRVEHLGDGGMFEWTGDHVLDLIGVRGENASDGQIVRFCSSTGEDHLIDRSTIDRPTDRFSRFFHQPSSVVAEKMFRTGIAVEMAMLQMFGHGIDHLVVQHRRGIVVQIDQRTRFASVFSRMFIEIHQLRMREGTHSSVLFSSLHTTNQCQRRRMNDVSICNARR